MKVTPEQLDRSLKKLAKAVAKANNIFPERDKVQQVNDLWDVFRESIKVLRKSGADKYYHEEMGKISKRYRKGQT